MLGQRYYNPASGRFLNRDPAGYAGGCGLYGYAGGNPVNAMDPAGTQTVIHLGPEGPDPHDGRGLVERVWDWWTRFRGGGGGGSGGGHCDDPNADGLMRNTGARRLRNGRIQIDAPVAGQDKPRLARPLSGWWSPDPIPPTCWSGPYLRPPTQEEAAITGGMIIVGGIILFVIRGVVVAL